MKIHLAKSSGFCFGVRRALGIAMETAKSGKTVEMLGDIVHNETVVKEIKRAGIKKIKRMKSGKNKILLIRAHGTARDTFTKAQRLGYKIVDATCPMVKEIHRIVSRMEKKGYRIIVIGDKKHDEVSGIVGRIRKKAVIIDNIEHIPRKTLSKIKRAAVVVQSTQNMDKIIQIVKVLENQIPELKFFNTVCRPTRLKQKEIKTLPLENDVMVIIGSKKSANTRRLYEISRSLNRKTYWVQSKKDLKPAWFKNIRNVGVTSGASTPVVTTMEVIDRIKKIKG